MRSMKASSHSSGEIEPRAVGQVSCFAYPLQGDFIDCSYSLATAAILNPAVASRPTMQEHPSCGTEKKATALSPVPALNL